MANGQNHGSISVWKRITGFPLVRFIYEAVTFILVFYLGKEFLIKEGLGLLSLDEALRLNLQGVLSIVHAFLSYIFVVRFFEKRTIFELDPQQLLKESSVGTCLAFGTISISFLLLGVIGVFTISGVNDGFDFVYPVIFVFLFALFEELVFRGFIYRISEEGLGTHWALIITAAPFGLLHLFNENADFLLGLSAMGGGLVLGILYTLTKRLWLPVFFHAAWNFSQSIYGSNISATDMFGAYLQGTLNGSAWLTGGESGVEGSVVTIALVFVLFAGLYWYADKHALIVKWAREKSSS